MASSAGFAYDNAILNYCNLTSEENPPRPTRTTNFTVPAVRPLQECILCMTNKFRVFPVSSAEARSGVAPSSRRYVRILQRRRSLPFPRHRGRLGQGRRLRWPASLVEFQRCRPLSPTKNPEGPGKARSAVRSIPQAENQTWRSSLFSISRCGADFLH